MRYDGAINDLLERCDALGVLESAQGRAGERGTFALVSGEAGVGKSALVRAFAARAERGATVYWGGCDPLVTPRPLGPLHDVARQAGGALASGLASGASREELFGALLDILDGPGPRPVLVIEDVHWADAATLDMLIFLGRRIARARALIVVTYRNDELGSDHPLRAALSTLPRDGVQRVELAPLSATAVAELARRADRDPGDLHDRSGGNPLLVAEVLAAVRPGVPATVRDLILARLRALSRSAQDVAQLVSVVPGRADSALIAGRARAVDACIGAGVLVPVDGGAAFRHELLRLAVHDSLTPVRRATLHAEVLAMLTSIDADPARLAHHAQHAGDSAALLRHAPVAAQRAIAVNAHREGLAHLRSVLPHIDALPVAEQAALLDRFGQQALVTGVAEEGLPALRRSLRIWEELGATAQVGENLRFTSRFAWWSGQPEVARTAAARSVEVLETLPASSGLAWALAHRSLVHYHMDEATEALEWGEKAIALAARIGDVGAGIDARNNVEAARIRFRGAGPEPVEHVFAAATAAGLDAVAMRALVNLAGLAVEKSDFTQGTAPADRAFRYALDHDLHGHTQFALGTRARVRLEQGDWAGARADAEEALAWPGVSRCTMQVPALVALGRIQSCTGDPAALETLDEAAGLAYPTGLLAWVSGVAAARSDHFFLAGDLDRSAAEARRWMGRAAERGHVWFAGALAWCAARAGSRHDLPTAIDSTHRMLIDGDWAGAAREMQARGAHFARAGALILGDEAAAAEALAIVDDTGATRVAERWRAQLRRSGLRTPRGPRRSTASNPAGLTARQLDVLTLLAQGHTNAEIAKQLTMSTKTVSHHVSGTLTKLGASRRGEAAAAAYRLGLVKIA